MPMSELMCPIDCFMIERTGGGIRFVRSPVGRKPSGAAVGITSREPDTLSFDVENPATMSSVSLRRRATRPPATGGMSSTLIGSQAWPLLNTRAGTANNTICVATWGGKFSRATRISAYSRRQMRSSSRRFCKVRLRRPANALSISIRE